MDGTDTRAPFRCPARECRNGQLGTDFGDTKHFYRHWYDTHQPRCPRTDCRFHNQKLSKATQFYFLRHWRRHYPELLASRSKCGKCERLFVNAANRDRHARKCNVSSTTFAGPTQQDFNKLCATEQVPAFNAGTAFDDVFNDWLPDSDNPNASSLAQGGTQTTLLDISDGPPSWPTEVSHPSAELISGKNDHLNLATTSKDPINTRPRQHMASESREWLLGLDIAPASRKQKTKWAGYVQHAADLTPGDWLSDTSWHRLGLPGHEGTTDMDTMSEQDAQLQNQESRKYNFGSSGLSLDLSPLSTPEKRESAGHQQKMGIDCRVIDDLPMRIRRHYAPDRRSTQWTEKRSKSRHVTKHKQVVAVISYVPSQTGYREVSSDEQVWIHKIIRKLDHNHPNIIETTSVIVNNVLNSKTKYPRMIDDHAPIWQLCATGQYDEVNRILSQNAVTVFDVNSAGRTLLHVAASYWQLDLCRLLLAKGADIEAREWKYECTPFSLACLESHIPQLTRRQPIDHSSNDLADVLSLLVQNGTDICAEIELRRSQTYLAVALAGSDAKTPWAMKRKLSRAFTWLSRNHRLVTTCDGSLPNVALPLVMYAALEHSTIFNAHTNDFWSLERSDCRIFMPNDIEALQSFWLSLIRGNPFKPLTRMALSSDFFMMYRIGFHYQGLLPFTTETVKTTTPLQVALRSFDTFARFHCILVATGTDPKAFAATESTMPWCNYTQQTLENLFSVDVDAYEKLKPLFKRLKYCRSSDRSPECFRVFYSNELLDWYEVIALVRSGRSLASLLRFPSEEEERRLHLASYYCDACTSKMAGSSYDQRFLLGGRDDEDTGFIEGEVLDSFVGDGKASTGDDGVMVDDQASFDESSSSEDFSDEEL